MGFSKDHLLARLQVSHPKTQSLNFNLIDTTDESSCFYAFVFASLVIDLGFVTIE